VVTTVVTSVGSTTYVDVTETVPTTVQDVITQTTTDLTVKSPSFLN
jgi:hypothetical protein